jgi:hypothetical protein
MTAPTARTIIGRLNSLIRAVPHDLIHLTGEIRANAPLAKQHNVPAHQRIRKKYLEAIFPYNALSSLMIASRVM